MDIITASEELRIAAKNLRFTPEDLVPVPGKDGRWRVPMDRLKEMPVFSVFMQIFIKNQYPNVVKRAEAQGLQITQIKGPDLLFETRGLSVQQNEWFICIRLKDPMVPSFQSSTVPDLLKHRETETAGNVTNKTKSDSSSSAPPEHGIDNLISATSQPQGPTPKADILLQLMRHELEFVVRSGRGDTIKGPALESGDHIELHEFSNVEVRAGALSTLTMALEVVRVARNP